MTASLIKTRPGTAADAAFAEVVEELTAKLQAREPLEVEVYVAKYPEHAERLRQLWPALQLLCALSEAGASGLSPSPAGWDQAPEQGTLGDFRIVREIGRGGMGVVYEAEQISLSRRVALKVLPLASTLDPRRLQRFHNEAKAAACLHHTNIVPVFAVGSERGVHFYAMQLIDGQTLAAAIHDLRQPPLPALPQPRGEGYPTALPPRVGEGCPTALPQPRGEGYPTALPPRVGEGGVGAASTAPVARLSTAKPGGDAAYFRKVAVLGTQAAEALDYAHQMGVVHRDIKPANLMLDGRGTLWVTDFGLAQLQADAGLTMTGDLLGTLRYMSPEQALAKRLVIDHRTDVYSLGATLYELLTLRPVFAGDDRQELLRQIAFEEPTPPRRLNKAIPAELETIVLKALEKNPADRYATAQELAADLERFVKDEPIRARRPSLSRRLKSWCRRHRVLVTGAAAIVVTALLLGGGTLWSRERQRAATAQAVGEDLQEAEVWQNQERWPEAVQALERATGRLAGSGLASLRDRVEGRRKDVALVARLEEARLQAFDTATGTEYDFAGADQAYRAAFAEHGLDVSHLAAPEAAGLICASAIRTHLVAALDHWALVKDNLNAGSGEPLREVAGLADDDDPWRQQLRDPAVRKDRSVLERLAGEERVLAQPPANIMLLSTALFNANLLAADVQMLRQAQRRHPTDFRINFVLASLLHDGDAAAAAEKVGFSRVALALRPLSPAARHNLGVALLEQDNAAEAIDAFKEAIALKPDFAIAHYSLGRALKLQGKTAEAIDAYKEAIKFKPDFALAYCNLGIVLAEQGKTAEAMDAYKEALKYKPDLPQAHYSRGAALEGQGKTAEAMDAYREVIKTQPDNAQDHYGRGLALRAMGKPAEAMDAFKEAIKLKPDYEDAHNSLGTVLAEQGNTAEAIDAYKQAIKVKPNYFRPHYNLGIELAHQGKTAEAIDAYREAIKLNPDFAEAHCNLGNALQHQGKTAAAMDAYKEALKHKPDLADAHYNIGQALEDQGKTAEAMDAYREGIKTKPLDAVAYFRRGKALRALGMTVEAMDAFNEAIKLKPGYAEAYSHLGVVLRDLGKTADAIDAYREAISLMPKNAEIRVSLGSAL